MDDDIKIVSRFSRKTKINISIAIFLIFTAIIVLTSINQIKSIAEKREKIVELEERLSWSRNENINLLALEKSLYGGEAIELEARKQFNMTKGDETNFSVVLKDDNPEQDFENSNGSASDDDIYSDADLWGNIKIFYDKEIKNN